MRRIISITNTGVRRVGVGVRIDASTVDTLVLDPTKTTTLEFDLPKDAVRLAAYEVAFKTELVATLIGSGELKREDSESAGKPAPTPPAAPKSSRGGDASA